MYGNEMVQRLDARSEHGAEVQERSGSSSASWTVQAEERDPGQLIQC